MATRVKGGSNNGSYFYFEYIIKAYNLAGNYTDVAWNYGVHWGDYYFNIHDAKLTMSTTSGSSISGDTSSGTYNSGWPISGAGTNRDHVIKTGTARVHHTSTGVGNIKFVGSAWWDTPTNFTSSVNTTISLPTIPQEPKAPSTPSISQITSTSVLVSFSDGSNGGTAIDSRQIGVGTSPTGADTPYFSSDGSTTISGLEPGTTYYFWARTHNAAGYSPWSGRSEATTLNVPDAPSVPMLSNIQPTSLTASFEPNGDGGATIDSYQIGYATVASGPTTTIAAISPQDITGLIPGTTYYFWARAHNSEGWGPWSEYASNSTIAGARVLVGGVWVIAIPYVRVAGVWVVTHPFVNVAGVWKEAG